MTTYIAIDIETTGLNKYSDRIVEIGALAFDSSGQELSRYNTLINPTIPIPNEVTLIHGITDDQVQDKPIFRCIVDSFFDFIESHHPCVLLAHNAVFDAGFINEEILRISREEWKSSVPKMYPVYCSLKLARRAIGGLRNYGLSDLARYYGFGLSASHRSMADCETLRDIWMRMNAGEMVENGEAVKYNLIRWI